MSGEKRKRDVERGEIEEKRETKRGKIDDKDENHERKDRKREEEREEVEESGRREKEKKRFECGICLELMCWEKEPRLFPCCGSSFCSSCLNKLFLLPTTPSPSSSSSTSPTKKGVRCPVCGKENEFESVESLEMNYLIPETIDVLLSSNLLYSFSSNSEGDEAKCENFETCGERTQMFCPICKMFICDTCEPSHISSIFSRNHKREQRNSWSDGGEGGRLGLENVKKKKECFKHPSEFISGYCFGCSVLVCNLCGHDTQKVMSIEESAVKKREEVVKIGIGLDNRSKVIEDRRKRVEEEIKELEEKLEKKRAEKKEIVLEEEDLRIRQDSIVRLSNTLSDISLFDDQLFSTLLQTAKEIVSEVGLLLPPKSICSDGVHFVSKFRFEKGVWGLSVNGDGNIFVSQDNGGGVIVVDKEGKTIEPLQTTLTSLKLEPIDVAIGLNDQIIVLHWAQCEYRVVILSKEGELIKSIGSNGSQDGQFFGPYGVEVDEKGRIIVADTFNHRIQVFNNDGSFLRSFGSKGSSEGQFDQPYSVAVDRDGNVVVCDWGNHRIQVLDIEGNFIRSFGIHGSEDGQLNCPRSVGVDGKGRIVVLEEGNGRVSVFEKDGTFLFSFGKDYMEKPWGIAVDSFGSIFVSDYDQKSVQLWE